MKIIAGRPVADLGKKRSGRPGFSIERTLRATGIALALLAIFGTVGSCDYADALHREAEEKQARPARAALLSHPIPWDAVVCQTGPDDPQRCRFYIHARGDR